jgi:hypothetical protein
MSASLTISASKSGSTDNNNNNRKRRTTSTPHFPRRKIHKSDLFDDDDQREVSEYSVDTEADDDYDYNSDKLLADELVDIVSSDGEELEEEEDEGHNLDKKLYCICQRLDTVPRRIAMFQCELGISDECKQANRWFHQTCMKLTPQEVKRVLNKSQGGYLCRFCTSAISSSQSSSQTSSVVEARLLLSSASAIDNTLNECKQIDLTETTTQTTTHSTAVVSAATTTRSNNDIAPSLPPNLLPINPDHHVVNEELEAKLRSFLLPPVPSVQDSALGNSVNVLTTILNCESWKEALNVVDKLWTRRKWHEKDSPPFWEIAMWCKWIALQIATMSDETKKRQFGGNWDVFLSKLSRQQGSGFENIRVGWKLGFRLIDSQTLMDYSKLVPDQLFWSSLPEIVYRAILAFLCSHTHLTHLNKFKNTLQPTFNLWFPSSAANTGASSSDKRPIVHPMKHSKPVSATSSIPAAVAPSVVAHPTNFTNPTNVETEQKLVMVPDRSMQEVVLQDGLPEASIEQRLKTYIDQQLPKIVQETVAKMIQGLPPMFEQMIQAQTQKLVSSLSMIASPPTTTNKL